MSDLLQLVVSEGASDLHTRVGTSPTIRVHGTLHRVEGPALTLIDGFDNQIEMFLKQLLARLPLSSRGSLQELEQTRAIGSHRKLILVS